MHAVVIRMSGRHDWIYIIRTLRGMVGQVVPVPRLYKYVGVGSLGAPEHGWVGSPGARSEGPN